MKALLENEGVPFRSGFLDFPDWTKRVKIDVGLSVNAPHSQVWLEKQNDVFVIGFEPVQKNIQAILNGESSWPINLDPNYIGKRMWIIPCALGNVSNHTGKMYITANDPGCSSLLSPKTFQVSETTMTQIWKLSDFLRYFPWSKFGLIEHLKIDVQGMDYEVLLGAEEYLSNILFVTVEIDTMEYSNSTNSLPSISSLLRSFGFRKIPTNRLLRKIWCAQHPGVILQTNDPTFYNKRLWKLTNYQDVFIYQNS